MRTLRKLLDYSEYALAALCVAGLAIMAALGVASVLFRFVLKVSLAFPDELIRYLFIWVIFLGSAIALRRKAHAAIGVLVESLPQPAKQIVLLLAGLTSAAFFALLVVKGAQLSIRVVPQISPALEISMAWVYAAVPVSAVFLLAYTLEALFRRRAGDAAGSVAAGG